MSTVIQFSPFLKILEIFGFQYFTLLKLDMSQRFPSRGYFFYFFVRVTFLACASIYGWLHYYRNLNRIRLTENLLGFLFQFIAAGLTTLRSFNMILEGFAKFRSNKRFLRLLNKFWEFTSAKDGFKTRWGLFRFKSRLLGSSWPKSGLLGLICLQSRLLGLIWLYPISIPGKTLNILKKFSYDDLCCLRPSVYSSSLQI